MIQGQNFVKQHEDAHIFLSEAYFGCAMNAFTKSTNGRGKIVKFRISLN